MKKILYIAAIALLSSACHFLDISPEMGLDDNEVFSYYTNAKAFFDQVYENPVQEKWDYRTFFATRYDENSYRSSLYVAVPAADNGRGDPNATMVRLRRGIMTEAIIGYLTNDNTKNRSPVGWACLRVIRVSNKFIENASRITDGKENEINDLLGQAYLMRGYAHFCLARFFGGMPHIDHALKADDDWDLERESLHDTYVHAAEDLYVAYEYFKKAGKMRRDTYPGTPGFLTASDFSRPNGTAALGLRARAMLYAASPLANPENNKEYWKEASEACALAINTALEEKYALQPFEKWKENFIEVAATNENLWAYARNRSDINNGYNIYLRCQCNKTSASGLAPVQNYVDYFEYLNPTEGKSYLLRTPEQRAEAARHGYNEEGQAFENRDPRFYQTLIYDGYKTKYNITMNNYKNKKGTWPTTKMTSSTSLAFGVEWGTKDSEANGYSVTGYGCQKYWRGNITNSSYYHLDAAIRLAELYLDYAEAVNEWSGASASASNANGLTAEQALNVIRTRAGMPNVPAGLSVEGFRERVRNERCVELAYEGHHYYYDVRRWKIAPEIYKERLIGMYVTEVDKDATHPNGRKYERKEIPENRQPTFGWKDFMYFIPFPNEEVNKMSKFKNNDAWQ